MVLQNRVTPMGNIVAEPSRGLFTGNRGILHDAATRTLQPTRRWTTKAWIICLCAFKGRRRDVMGRNGRNGREGWTELFFLDEATALSAGHRPCFECRREDARRFRAAWAEGNGCEPPPVKRMDAILHAERLDGRAKRLHPLPGPANLLPDGTMVTDGTDAFLVRDGSLRRWSFDGYGPATAAEGDLKLLTPPSTVRALAAGCEPVLHGSAVAD